MLHFCSESWAYVGTEFTFPAVALKTAVLPVQLAILLTLLAGCLPSSCRRETSRALLPADSLSRQTAAAVPVDTLEVLWRAAASEGQPLAYPRTVRFSPEGRRLYVSDAERNSIFVFDQRGTPLREITAEGFDIPYLAGFRGDTLLVFSPEARRIDFVVGGRSVRRVPTPEAVPEAGRLQYAAASDGALYVKLLGDDFPGYIARLDERGEVAARYPLPGPSWRHAGLLHAWGDTLLSLSGFRPVVDVLTPGGRLDTLALVGFDSPMLARSRSFLLGDVAEAPLLSAAAAPAGDLLFVLNLRPGWLRVDVYDRTGRLQHVLVQPAPGLDRRFFPVDLGVHRRPDGEYLLAVLTGQPIPALTLYRWTGPAAGP